MFTFGKRFHVCKNSEIYVANVFSILKFPRRLDSDFGGGFIKDIKLFIFTTKHYYCLPQLSRCVRFTVSFLLFSCFPFSNFSLRPLSDFMVYSSSLDFQLVRSSHRCFIISISLFFFEILFRFVLRKLLKLKLRRRARKMWSLKNINF